MRNGFKASHPFHKWLGNVTDFCPKIPQQWSWSLGSGVQLQYLAQAEEMQNCPLEFFTIIFLWLNYPPGGRQGFGITHSAFHQAVRYGAGRSDSKAWSLRHQGETARPNLEAAGHWGNELMPCDPLLQGFSGLEKDNVNVYSKLFPGKKYKNKILPKSHNLIWFCFTLFIPSDGKFLHRTEKCIYLSKNSEWKCSSPLRTWPCLSLVGRPIYLCLTMTRHVSLYYSLYSINAEW